MNFRTVFTLLCAVIGATIGCTKSTDSDAKGMPTFSLAWSEYPSWSVFGVAHAEKLIHMEAGKLGSIEKKWGVDIVLRQLEYDGCLTQYANGDVDAVCITNMDILSPSLSRDSVAIAPTSTSNGADACIVVGINSVQDLKGQMVYGLGASVSEYCFVRNLEELGEQESDYKFTDKTPLAASMAMQNDPKTTNAVVVWNPFVLQLLQKVEGSKRLFDSSTIKGEIVDVLVVASDTLKKEGGENFACAIIDAFYQVSDKIEDPATRDKTLLSLAAKFDPDLGVKDMNVIVKETEFFKTPEEGIGLFSGSEFPSVMEKVISFCSTHNMIEKQPTISYGDNQADLQFSTSYMQRVKDKQ